MTGFGRGVVIPSHGLLKKTVCWRQSPWTHCVTTKHQKTGMTPKASLHPRNNLCMCIEDPRIGALVLQESFGPKIPLRVGPHGTHNSKPFPLLDITIKGTVTQQVCFRPICDCGDYACLCEKAWFICVCLCMSSLLLNEIFWHFFLLGLG